MRRGLGERHVPPAWISDETPWSGDGAEVLAAGSSWQCFPSCCGAWSQAWLPGPRAPGSVASSSQCRELRARVCHEFHPCEPQRLCASSALVFSPHRGSAGWHLFPAPHNLAAVSLPLQAEPHVLQQPRQWPELQVWACVLLFWSLSHCLRCRTRFGWPGLCRRTLPVGRAWLERAWLSLAGFWTAAPGSVCHWDRVCSQAGSGGTGYTWQCPSKRAPVSLSERILASAWGQDTVPEAALSWHTHSCAAAYGMAASGTSGRGPLTGSSGLGEGSREDTGQWGAVGQR